MLVVVALSATKLVAYKLVLVAFWAVKLVTPRLVAVAFVAKKLVDVLLVVRKLVDVALIQVIPVYAAEDAVPTGEPFQYSEPPKLYNVLATDEGLLEASVKPPPTAAAANEEKPFTNKLPAKVLVAVVLTTPRYPPAYAPLPISNPYALLSANNPLAVAF